MENYNQAQAEPIEKLPLKGYYGGKIKRFSIEYDDYSSQNIGNADGCVDKIVAKLEELYEASKATEQPVGDEECLYIYRQNIMQDGVEKHFISLSAKYPATLKDAEYLGKIPFLALQSTRTTPEPKRVQVLCPGECDDGTDWSSGSAEKCKDCRGFGVICIAPEPSDDPLNAAFISYCKATGINPNNQPVIKEALRQAIKAYRACCAPEPSAGLTEGEADKEEKS